ncbi:hypothetical protein PLICRDRAFT_33268, partial [Plicaturopsis crispa FD-325 SS-3]
MKVVRAAYRKLITGKSAEEVDALMKPIREWCREYERGNIGNSRKTAGTMIREAAQQFNGLARAYEIHDVAVVGAIVSTAADGDGANAGGIFGTDPALLEFINANKINVRIFMEWIRTCINAHKYSLNGVNLPLLPGMQVDADDKGKGKSSAKGTEAKDGRSRDAMRHGVTDKLVMQIRRVLPTQAQMPWSNWFNVAWLRKVKIRNWPKGVEAPGPDFRFKRLGLQDLAKLLDGTVDEGGVLREVEIVKWTDEELALPEDSASLARVAIIVDSEGRALKRVFDSKAFLKSRAKKGKGKATEVVDDDDNDNDNDGDGDGDGDNNDDNDVNVVVEKGRAPQDGLPMAPLPRRAAGGLVPSAANTMGALGPLRGTELTMAQTRPALLEENRERA